MALPATDNFNLVQGDPLSANWTIVVGSFDIALGHVTAESKSAGNNLAVWNADSFNANQYSTVTATLVSTGYVYNGIAVRASLVAVTCYNYAVSEDQQVFIDRIIDGDAYDLALSYEYAADGDTLRLEVDGSSITAKRNGAVQFSGAKTDANIESGSAGLYFYGSSINSTVDNWEGGNLAAAGLKKQITMHYYRQRRTT